MKLNKVKMRPQKIESIRDWEGYAEVTSERDATVIFKTERALVYRRDYEPHPAYFLVMCEHDQALLDKMIFYGSAMGIRNMVLRCPDYNEDEDTV